MSEPTALPLRTNESEIMWVTFDVDGAANSHRLWISKPERKGQVFVGQDERGWVILKSYSAALVHRELKPGECVEVITSEVMA